LLAFAGVSLVISRGELFSLFASDTIRGDLLMLLNAIAWAVFTLYGKKIMAKYSPFTAVAYIHIFGALMFLPVILVPNALNPVSVLEQIARISLPSLGAIIYLAGLCSVYAYFTWYKAIGQIGAVRTVSFQYLNPLFALLAGVLLMRESVSALMVTGGIMVIGGVFLINKQTANIPAEITQPASPGMDSVK
jgi:drug/metabolite transporter (DMT)-like permease